MNEFADMLVRLGLSLADFVLFLGRLRESPWWQGRLVQATFRAGQASITFPTGLGRAHRGGVMATSTAALPVFVLPANNPTDMTLYVSAAPVVDVTFGMWVF